MTGNLVLVAPKRVIARGHVTLSRGNVAVPVRPAGREIIVRVSINITIGVRAMGRPPPPPSNRIFQIAIFGHKKRNIRAKPLDFRASNEENIRVRELSPPPQTKHVPYAYEYNK